MDITAVADPAFSSKMMGDGFAIDLTEGEVVAPFDAEVTAAFPTGHAYGLRRKDGVECLIHIGMDTVELNGEGFDVKVEQGAKVKAGPDSGSGRFRGSKGKGQISGDSGDLPKRSRIYYEQKGWNRCKG